MQTDLEGNSCLSISKYTAQSFLNAFHEVLEIALAARTSTLACHDAASRVDVTLKAACEDQVSEEHGNLFNFKVCCNWNIPLCQALEDNRVPELCKFILLMQSHEKEGHLAVQSVYNDDAVQTKHKKVLFLNKSNTESFAPGVDVMHESCKRAKDSDELGTVITIRVFLSSEAITKVDKSICSLLERLKFMNPKVQISCDLHTALLNLRETDSIKSNGYQFFSKYLQNKYSDEYRFSECHLECSDIYDLVQPSADTGSESINTPLTGLCAIYALPMHHLEGQVEDSSIKMEKEDVCTSIFVHLQFCGPHMIPVNITSAKLKNHLGLIIPLSDYGFVYNRPPRQSDYFLQAWAQLSADCTPTWAQDCQSMCLVLVYLVDHKHEKRPTVAAAGLGQKLLNHLLTHDNVELLQKSALSVLSKLFVRSCPLVNDIKEESTIKEDKLPESQQIINRPIKEENKTHQETLNEKHPKEMQAYKKFIPDVAKSLTDIFMRSTNFSFRSAASEIMPTGTRKSLCYHLERGLEKSLQNSSCYVSQASPEFAGPAEENSVDEWAESETIQAVPEIVEDPCQFLEMSSLDKDKEHRVPNLGNLENSILQENVCRWDEKRNPVAAEVCSSSETLPICTNPAGPMHYKSKSFSISQDNQNNCSNVLSSSSFCLNSYNPYSLSQPASANRYVPYQTNNLTVPIPRTNLPPSGSESLQFSHSDTRSLSKFHRTKSDDFSRFIHSQPTDRYFENKSISQQIGISRHNSSGSLSFLNKDSFAAHSFMKENTPYRNVLPRKRSFEVASSSTDYNAIFQSHQFSMSGFTVGSDLSRPAITSASPKMKQLPVSSRCSQNEVDQTCRSPFQINHNSQGLKALTNSENCDNDDSDWFDDDEFTNWKAQMEL